MYYQFENICCTIKEMHFSDTETKSNIMYNSGGCAVKRNTSVDDDDIGVLGHAD